MSYVIHWTNGDSDDEFDSTQECLDAIERIFPDYYAGHDGDLSDGGDRTLVWACEADSLDDDGARAVASIRQGGLNVYEARVAVRRNVEKAERPHITYVVLTDVTPNRGTVTTVHRNRDDARDACPAQGVVREWVSKDAPERGARAYHTDAEAWGPR